ncbi:MAG: AIM24 family protein [Ruminococcus sp.]|nr:AIM24 family protein [Ruminococcus sp.]
MVTFETMNELCLRITNRGSGDHVYTKAGAFIGGECMGAKNYTFTKVMLGPQENQNIGQALLGQLTRRITGENLPLMKVDFNGDSVTYYANDQQHVVVYHLMNNETISVESENILAFTRDCKYSVRFLGQGVISQKGLATSTLTGMGPDAYVAVLVDGNPLVMSNVQTGYTIEADPDATVCWIGADPQLRTDINWRNFIGQSSGESYMYEWGSGSPATVIIQPMERPSGVDVSMDGRRSGSRPSTQRRIY